MYDEVLQFAEIATKQSTILQRLGVQPRRYLLATVHRPYNADVDENLRNIIAAFGDLAEPVVFPVHPRTRRKLAEPGWIPGNVMLLEPAGYLDMLVLEQNARLILTDSGGIQKEAYFFGIPCVTLRPETEWIETVQDGWNILAGANREQIVHEVTQRSWPTTAPRQSFGDGHASEAIVRLLQS
jgi:UDP-N-acetylglucosamine 2-epimerase